MSLYAALSKLLFPEKPAPFDMIPHTPVGKGIPAVLELQNRLLLEGSFTFKHSGDNTLEPLDPEPFLEEFSGGRSHRFEVGLVFRPRAGCDQNRENYVWKE